MSIRQEEQIMLETFRHMYRNYCLSRISENPNVTSLLYNAATHHMTNEDPAGFNYIAKEVISGGDMTHIEEVGKALENLSQFFIDTARNLGTVS